MIKTLAVHIIAYRKTILFLSLLLILSSMAGFKNLYFESSTDMWFLKDDPVLVEYNHLKDRFENNEFLVVGLKASPHDQNVLNKATMQAIEKMTDFLEAHPAVTKVTSLSKYQYIHGEDDYLAVDDIMPEDSEDFELSQEQWSAILAVLQKEIIPLDILFTKDLKHTVIAARVIEQEDYTGEDNAKIQLVNDFKDFLAKNDLNNQTFKLFLSGSAAIGESYFASSIADQSLIYPLMMVLILVFLFALFRTWTGTLFPFIIVVASVVVTIGSIGFLGWSMNVLNVSIMTILVVIALADSIHILMGFYASRNEGLESKEAAIAAVQKYFLPCFFTTITTAVGFLALASSQLRPVVEFGLAVPIGVFAAFFFSVFSFPAILSYIHSKPENTKRLIETGFIANTIKRLSGLVVTKAHQIIIVFVLLMIPVLYFCSTIIVDTNFVRNFKDDSPLRQGLGYFDETYKGALSLEFMLDSGKYDGVKEPAFMQRALDFQNYVSSLDGCGKAISMTNYLMKINQVMHNEEPSFFKVPESREMVGQYLLLYSNSGPNEDLSDLMNFDGRYMRISVFFEVAPSSVTKARVDEIQRHIDQHFQDLNIKTTGRAVLFNRIDNYVIEGLISSFSLAILVIAICFLILLRSIKYGLLALFPNVIPILVAGAIMGVFHIYLDFSTLMVAAVTLGIAVDDTIHIMTQYVHAKRNDMDNQAAIQYAINTSGPAILSTSIILIAGFSILTLSSFVPSIYTGVLGCIVILFALITDLILLPAILIITESFFAKKMVA